MRDRCVSTMIINGTVVYTAALVDGFVYDKMHHEPRFNDTPCTEHVRLSPRGDRQWCSSCVGKLGIQQLAAPEFADTVGIKPHRKRTRHRFTPVSGSHSLSAPCLVVTCALQTSSAGQELKLMRVALHAASGKREASAALVVHAAVTHR